MSYSLCSFSWTLLNISTYLYVQCSILGSPKHTNCRCCCSFHIAHCKLNILSRIILPISILSFKLTNQSKWPVKCSFRVILVQEVNIKTSRHCCLSIVLHKFLNVCYVVWLITCPILPDYVKSISGHQQASQNGSRLRFPQIVLSLAADFIEQNQTPMTTQSEEIS